VGNFAQYQTGQGMMAHFFLLEGWHGWLYPKLYVLCNGKPSLVLLYYPVASAAAAIFQKVFGGSIGVWGRFQSVFFFSFAALFLFLLIRTLWNYRIAIISLIVFSLFPLTLIYGQSFQNEMAAVFFSTAFLYYYVLAVKRGGWGYTLSASALFSALLLTRPNCAYLIIPALALLFLKDFTEGRPFRHVVFQVFTLFGFALILPVLWYWHIWCVSQTASNIYGTVFLQLSSRASFLSSLILSPHYYKTIYDLMAGIVLTPLGFTMLILGLFVGRLDLRKSFLFYFWLFASLLPILLTPRKFIDHDFYWLHTLPPAALFIALAFNLLVNALNAHKKFLVGFVSLFLVIAATISLRYSLHPAFQTSPQDARLLKMAEKVKFFTKPTVDRIVVQDTYNLLYYADRLGWVLPPLAETLPVSPYLHKNYGRNLDSIQYEELRHIFSNPVTALQYLIEKEGATYLIVTNLQEFRNAVSFSNHVFQSYAKVYDAPEIGMIFRLKGQ
jgi:4-amino-4-deoxy-L-arabinose transferase-like glycosyltransferase